jgi:hypothetical protein
VAALGKQLEMLLLPQTIAPLLELAFATSSEGNPAPLLSLCGVVEWILRNTASEKLTQGPRLSLLNFVAFRSGQRAFLRQMWATLSTGGLLVGLQE